MSRNIVITGVSRGLGRAMVDQLVDRGHQVSGCATNAEAIEGLRKTYGSPHRFDVVDISHADKVDAWAQEVLAQGTPDLLINNAAVINRSEPLWEVHPSEFESLMNINIGGTYHVIRSFLPCLLYTSDAADE